MIIDLDLYKVNKPFIRDWLIIHKNRSIRDAISILSNALNCPCLVTAFYISELAGWSEDVIECIKGQKEYYRYEDVINMPANCPESIRMLFPSGSL